MNQTIKPDRSCQHCGYLLRSTDAPQSGNCPKCGARYPAAAAHTDARSATLTKKRTRAELDDYVDHERRRLAHLVYVLYLLPTGFSMLLGYSIAQNSSDDFADEIACAHRDWQIETVSRVFYVILVLLGLLVIAGAARGSYLLINQDALRAVSVVIWKLALAIAAMVYLWIAARSIMGWMRLFKSEGP